MLSATKSCNNYPAAVTKKSCTASTQPPIRSSGGEDRSKWPFGCHRRVMAIGLSTEHSTNPPPPGFGFSREVVSRPGRVGQG